MTGSPDRDSRDRSPSTATAFYDRWADLYDLVSRRAPGAARLRRQGTNALRLDRGDVVVEMGCGTGANLPLLAEAVGPEGRVIGIDRSPGVLARARRLTADYPQVDVVRGDVTHSPVADGVDGVLATFVVGMLDDPAETVDSWCDLVAPGGHVVLANLRKSRHPAAPLVNPLLAVVTVTSTPPTTKLRYDEDLAATLDARVRAAHEALRRRATATAENSHFLDLAGVTGGRIE